MENQWQVAKEVKGHLDEAIGQITGAMLICQDNALAGFGDLQLIVNELEQMNRHAEVLARGLTP